MLILLTVDASAIDETNSIIAEWSPIIQIISLSGQAAWPYSSGPLPLDVSPIGDRLTAIWPQSLISLDSRGRGDRYTLLALFATSTAEWISGEWTPENGVLCSDGFWRAVVPGFGLYELNLSTGLVTRRSVAGIVKGPVYPGVDGRLITLGEEGPMIISPTGETQPLPGSASLASLVAFSTDEAKVAWISSTGGHLRSHHYDTEGPSGFTVAGAMLGNDVNWSLDWVNDSVVIGRSGYLLVLSPMPGDRPESPPRMERLTDPRLPRRWYRVRGGTNRLLLHSPELPGLALVTPSESDDIPPGEQELFPEVLKAHVLDAGSLLEGQGNENAAESFYAWALPLIRANRSRQILDSDWAELEQEITDRRSRLREGF